MNTACTSLLAALALAAGGCDKPAAPAPPPPGDGGLHLVALRHVQDNAYLLRFAFTNTTGKPIGVYAYDSPDDGECILANVDFAILTPEGWQFVDTFKCGTGLEIFSLQPGRSYHLAAPMNLKIPGAKAYRLLLLMGAKRIYSEPFMVGAEIPGQLPAEVLVPLTPASDDAGTGK